LFSLRHGTPQGRLLQLVRGEVAMPLPKDTRYRVVQTPKGPVRLAFHKGEVIEAKNEKTGATHSPREFAADRKRKGKK
jgi:hypothetical protein